MDLLRERFLKTYANIPLSLRDEIVLVFDDKPITWNVAYLEVKEKTPRADRVLDELNKLGLIQTE